MPGSAKEPKAQLDRYSSLEDWSGYVLLVGLVLETAILFIFSDGKSRLQIALEAVAYIAVFGGVFGEIMFAARARGISEQLSNAAAQQVAEANARANEANQRTEELRARFAWRILNNQQFQILVSALTKMQPQLEGKLATWVYNSDEAANFHSQIDDAIGKAGFISRISAGQSGGKVPFYGTRVDSRSDFPELAAALCEALRSAGIDADFAPVDYPPYGHAPGHVMLGVSVKPPP